MNKLTTPDQERRCGVDRVVPARSYQEVTGKRCGRRAILVEGRIAQWEDLAVAPKLAEYQPYLPPLNHRPAARIEQDRYPQEVPLQRPGGDEPCAGLGRTRPFQGYLKVQTTSDIHPGSYATT